MEKVYFDKDGSCHIPDKIHQAQVKFWGVVETYLADLSLVECRALFFTLDFTEFACGYLLRRQFQNRHKAS